VHATELLIKAATVLNKPDDICRYSALHDTIQTAFLQTYGRFDTRATQTQTAYMLALAFDLLPDLERPTTAARLAAAIHDNHDHLATGFLGTPYLLPVLSRFGYDSLAYRVLLQTTCPSWLYPITRGATTIWEKWDAIRPDSSLQATSFNHYAYGAVGDWLYRYVAGIAPDPSAPGYQRVIMAPHPGGNLTWCKASYVTAHGLIRVRWKVKHGKFTLGTFIPPNTTACVTLPGQAAKNVQSGKHHFQCPLHRF